MCIECKIHRCMGRKAFAMLTHSRKDARDFYRNNHQEVVAPFFMCMCAHERMQVVGKGCEEGMIYRRHKYLSIKLHRYLYFFCFCKVELFVSQSLDVPINSRGQLFLRRNAFVPHRNNQCHNQFGKLLDEF